MRSVRLKFSFEGYRYPGGPKWPPFNGVLETGDEEAARFVEAGWAVYLEDEPEPVIDGMDRVLRQHSPYYEPSLDPDNREQDADGFNEELEPDELLEELDAAIKRPYTNASKAAWIEYATSQGEDPETAEAMSKADLISKYGASL